ncbi:la-related protein 1C [Typha angustifolia]|uniref:la-related protein 1C n=1 Tax=Typha angustifolia TaxID=59011 RepID=UPI003C2FBC08
MASNPDRHDRTPVEIDGSPIDAGPGLASPGPANVAEDGSGAAVVKKPAWKRPSNGAIEVGPVMGAESWPALSESATGKVTPKASDGSLASSPGPTISTSSSPKKNTNNLSPNSIPNHTAPVRQKSNKNMAPAPMLDKQAIVEDGQPNRNINSWEHGNRSGGDHHRRYGGNNRRGNNGGGGAHHGGRHDQERGGFDGYNRNLVGRDIHLQQQQQQQRGVRPPFIRAPLPVVAPPPPFISPPPQARPFGNPMGFPEVTSPVYYVPPPPETLRGVPFVSHPVGPPAFIIPAIDPQRALLLKQIDYYFSSENLCKDIFLRQNMDDQGWVPISLIAGFNRVKQLTNNLAFIMETVQLSTIVELQGDKIRRRNDWMIWVLPQPENFTAAGPLSPATPNVDIVASRFRTVGLEGASDHYSMRSTSGEVVLGRSASGHLNNQAQVVEGLHDGISQANEHNDSDQSESVKSLPRSDSI